MPMAWREVRALLITCALLLGFIAGWPELGPRVLARLSPGSAALARRIPALRDGLLRPFAPLAAAFGIYTQNWPLFTGTGAIRHRMWIEGRGQAGEWTLLYRVHDADHTALQSTIEYRRVFNLWNPHRWGVSDSYPAFVHWVAARLFSERPELDEVRVSQEQIEIAAAGSGFVSTGRFDYIVSVTRAQVVLP
jgi:hypothetical protein